MVERFFAEITENQIRRGVHRSVKELEKWLRTADEILDAIKRLCLHTVPDNSATYL